MLIFEPRSEKTGFLHMRNTKAQISFTVTVKLISAFVFTTRIVQSLYFLNPKFQASSHLLWLYSPVCEDQFSHNEAHLSSNLILSGFTLSLGNRLKRSKRNVHVSDLCHEKTYLRPF